MIKILKIEEYKNLRLPVFGGAPFIIYGFGIQIIYRQGRKGFVEYSSGNING